MMKVHAETITANKALHFFSAVLLESDGGESVTSDVLINFTRTEETIRK